MRFVTYIVPGDDPSLDGDCGVYAFGPGAGGGVDANLQRWIGEFEAQQATHTTSHVRGLTVTRVRITGTYRAHTESDGSAVAPRPGTELLGAIVEGPKGDVFFTLLGPVATLDRAQPEFDAMLASVRPRPAS